MYRGGGKGEKNPADRIRRNPETYVIDNVEWDGVKRGPSLPRGRTWCVETKRWWDQWRKSPQSMLMTDSDWDFMLDTALLHNMLWSQGEAEKFYDENRPGGRRPNGAVSTVQLAAEIRQRVAKFGATYEDRKKLRMVVSSPALEQMNEDRFSEDADDAVDYAERLLKKAAEKK